MEHNDGGPAFPWGEHGQILGGMTLRDYFAAKAMQGLLANPSITDIVTNGSVEYVVEGAFAIADDMIAASEARSQS